MTEIDFVGKVQSVTKGIESDSIAIKTSGYQAKIVLEVGSSAEFEPGDDVKVTVTKATPADYDLFKERHANPTNIPDCSDGEEGDEEGYSQSPEPVEPPATTKRRRK